MMHASGMIGREIRGGRTLAIAALLATISTACGGSILPQGGATDLTGPWQAEPYAVAQPLMAEAELLCRDGIGAMVGPDNVLVVVDARGGGILVLTFAGQKSSSICELLASSSGNLSTSGGTGRESDQALQEPAPNELRMDGVSNSGARSTIAGQAGAMIAAVEVVVPGGPRVRASLGRDGWFTAWWPTDETDVQVNGYDSAGTLVGSAR
jgi:hypothetical protein